jgi:hypothetical protein
MTRGAEREARHARRLAGAPLLLGALLTSAPAAHPADLDRNMVGAWVLPVNAGRWLWQINQDGTYTFHSEAADGVPPHNGKFSASGGMWALIATNGYSDGGPYRFVPPDAFTATGRLGSATWRRLANLDNDPDTIGTWQLIVNGKPWVWEIHLNGLYDFHSEAGDGVPPQSGTFAASAGYWWLQAANGYADGGTYSVQAPDAFVTTGQLGTATWHHPTSGGGAHGASAASDSNDADPCFVKALEAAMQTGQGQQCK